MADAGSANSGSSSSNSNEDSSSEAKGARKISYVCTYVFARVLSCHLRPQKKTESVCVRLKAVSSHPPDIIVFA